MNIIDLGEDILCEVCTYLSLPDIMAFSLTCATIHDWVCSNDVFHKLFLRRFGHITPLDPKKYKWSELLKIRSSKDLQFYTWGSGTLGRLGYSPRDVSNDRRARHSFGIHTPTIVSNFKDIIIESILSGGFSFQLLIDGAIYSTGMGYNDGSGRMARPGPQEPDYAPHLDFLTEQIGVHVGVGLRHPIMLVPQLTTRENEDNWNERIKKSSFLTLLRIPSAKSSSQRKIRRISSGRMHILALDNHGVLYSWDSGNHDPELAVQIILPDIDGSIQDISAGWDMSACNVRGTGLLYWHSREPVSKEKCEDKSFESAAFYSIVPQLQLAINFTCLSDTIVYIALDGLLYAYDAPETHDPQSIPKPVSLFNRWLMEHTKNLTEPLFTKISGSFKSFSVFTSNGLVLLGNIDGDCENWIPELLPEIQNTGVIDIVNGDYHKLALTDDGELWSWGIELQRNGCLGLGDLSSSTDDTIINEGLNARVTVPKKVPKPSKGRWLAVTAGGWHSGGLFIAGI
ncbi:hypothetical protein PUMCH_001504 [Australozyma saopauloensis]|uniref:F-box domain-containing protein n=1 Tax=Australozyma saopauloensis TaxID=291208 RepID=A0AAX4H8D3_9ASCO|nr:hypothetical protein PUMCH_001504 [[Candida] saopauloensis]